MNEEKKYLLYEQENDSREEVDMDQLQRPIWDTWHDPPSDDDGPDLMMLPQVYDNPKPYKKRGHRKKKKKPAPNEPYGWTGAQVTVTHNYYIVNVLAPSGKFSELSPPIVITNDKEGEE